MKKSILKPQVAVWLFMGLLFVFPYQNCTMSLRIMRNLSAPGEFVGLDPVSEIIPFVPPTSDGSAGPGTPSAPPAVDPVAGDGGTSAPLPEQMGNGKGVTNGNSTGNQNGNHFGIDNGNAIGNPNRFPASDDEPADVAEEPADFDHLGRKMGFACNSGATSDLSVNVDLKTARDFEFRNERNLGPLELDPAHEVEINGLRADSLDVKAAHHIVEAQNILVPESRLNARSIDLVQNLNAPVSSIRAGSTGQIAGIRSNVSTIVTGKADSVEDIGAHSFCLSGQEIRSVDNIRSDLVKIVGRTDGGSPAHIVSVSRMNADTSISNVNIDLIQNVTGLLVIRASEIGEIKDFEGRLVLIGSKVKKMTRVHGEIIVKEAAPENPDAEPDPSVPLR